MIDVKALTDWLGPEGARAGLLESKLSIKDLADLVRACGLPVSSKPTREELANELSFMGISKLDRDLKQLMTMNQDDLLAYLKKVRPTLRELSSLLTELGIRPSSFDRQHLYRFVAREISDTGLYERVAHGPGDRIR
jgi:hypothetical protein